MNHRIVKSLALWLTIVAIFSLGFYLSSQRNQRAEITANSDEQRVEKMIQDSQEIPLKQKLISDFEEAFLKQYTPPVGCEVFQDSNQPAECRQHLQQEKNEFKAVFIKDRGLPKNTFEELKLSFTE